MSIETTEKLYTIAEFLALDLEDMEDYELIGGELVRKGTTGAQHSKIVGKVTTFLSNFGGEFAGEKQLGTVYPGGSTNLGNPAGKTFPKPDVCFVRLGNGPASFENIITVAPDLVVEVNSPSDTDERRFEKLQAYQQAGVKLIWSINMLEKFVLVYQQGEIYPRFVNFEGELDGGEVLPGLKIAVRSLF